jgi:hypothetical protein
VTTAQIVREIARRGHTISLDGETLVIRPRMTEALRDRVRAHKPDILAYLRELDGPPATGHTFVALTATASATTASASPVEFHGACTASRLLIRGGSLRRPTMSP